MENINKYLITIDYIKKSRLYTKSNIYNVDTEKYYIESNNIEKDIIKLKSKIASDISNKTMFNVGIDFIKVNIEDLN